MEDYASTPVKSICMNALNKHGSANSNLNKAAHDCSLTKHSIVDDHFFASYTQSVLHITFDELLTLTS